MKELKRRAMLYLQGMLDGLVAVSFCGDSAIQEKALTECNAVIGALQDLKIINDNDIQQLNIRKDYIF